MSNKMFSYNLLYFVFFLLIEHNYSTMVKYYQKSSNLMEGGAESDVINIHSNYNKKKDKDAWSLPYFPDESHHSMFALKNDMFDVNPECDNGKENITLDLGNLAINSACFSKTIEPDIRIQPILHEDLMPKEYDPPHICMKQPIEYTDPMISYGAHRPLWGQYGEYEFIPKQRWLHNLEHGAVVMLYHPCAHPMMVDKLKNLVTSCLRRHIITPYNRLSPERPLAIYTWGKYLSMNTVNHDVVVDFIKKNALAGPEDIAEDGKYNHLLIKNADHVSYPSDSVICPSFPRD